MTTITVSSYALPNWQYGGSTAKLRIYADRTFVTSDNTIIEIGSPNGGKFYKEVGITISGSNATIAQFTIDSTRDARVTPTARYNAYFFDSNGVQLGVYDGFTNFQVPEIFSTGTTTTWAAIRTFNAAAVPIGPDLSTYSRSEVDRLINNIMPGGLATLANGGTGSNLSATGAGFLVQATTGANVTVRTLQTSDVSSCLTIREVDLNPSFNFTTIEFDQSTGLQVTNQGSGVGRVSLGSFPLTSTTGTLQPSRGGTGATATPTDGQLLIGNTAMGIFAVASLGTGNSISATTGAGTLSIDTIQDIRTSASPSFAAISLNTQAGLTLLPYNTSAGNTSELRFRELAANGTNYVAIKSPDSLSANYTLVLPTAQGSASTMLTNDGSGNLSWTTPPGAGSGYNQIQEEGSNLTQRSTLNFIGAALTAADTGAKTNVTLSQSPNTSTSVVGVDRTITAGTGLSGGGDLSADRTLAVTNNTTTQKIKVSKGGTLIGTRQEVNLIEGTNVTLTVSDNAGADRVDVTIASSGGGGGGGGTLTGTGTSGRISKWSAATALTDSLFSEPATNTVALNQFTAASTLRFMDDDGSNYVGLKAPGTVASDVTLTLPSVLTATTATNRYLQTDASGNLSVAAAVGSLALNSSGTDVALANTGNDYTLSIPSASATARGVITTGSQTLAGQKTFTSSPIISLNSPSLLFTNTGATKHLQIAATGNTVDLRETAASSGSLLALDLANNRAGFGTASPATIVDIKGTLTLSGSTSGSVKVLAPASGGTATYTLPGTDAAGYFKSDGAGNLSFGSAYNTVKDNGGSAVTSRSVIKFTNGTNTTVSVTDTGGETVVAYSATGGGSVSSVTGGDDITASPTTGSVVLGRTTMDGSATISTGAYWLLPSTNIFSTAASTVSAANQVRVFRFYLPMRLTVTSIAFDVATAGGTISVGLYNGDGTTRLINSTATTSTGTISTAVAPSVTLPPGMYCLAWTSNSASSASGLRCGAVGASATNAWNSDTVQLATAANSSSSGVLPATLGVLTASAITGIPIVKLQA